jgi:hypothetical protein
VGGGTNDLGRIIMTAISPTPTRISGSDALLLHDLKAERAGILKDDPRPGHDALMGSLIGGAFGAVLSVPVGFVTALSGANGLLWMGATFGGLALAGGLQGYFGAQSELDRLNEINQRIAIVEGAASVQSSSGVNS